jgi:isoleucyl-tRNA synthetase
MRTRKGRLEARSPSQAEMPNLRPGVAPYLKFANGPRLRMISFAMPEFSKTYDPKSVEPKCYRRWLADGDFRADPRSPRPAFSIVIPPPNITGVLTLGHVLNNTIQDILARRARILGFEVLWLPGTDHAGIATQTAVEKWLRKNEGVTRHDLGRCINMAPSSSKN